MSSFPSQMRGLCPYRDEGMGARRENFLSFELLKCTVSNATRRYITGLQMSVYIEVWTLSSLLTTGWHVATTSTIRVIDTEPSNKKPRTYGTLELSEIRCAKEKCPRPSGGLTVLSLTRDWPSPRQVQEVKWLTIACCKRSHSWP